MIFSNAHALEVANNALKVNSEGTYVDFQGVTIIADISDEDREFFQSLYDAIKEIPMLTDYYALLPVSSYHMTTTNLYTDKFDGKGDWMGLINRNLPMFSAMHRRLEQMAFAPRARLDKVAADRTVKLVVTLSPEQTKTIENFADDYGIRNKIPPHFHITLGYLYKDIPNEILQRLRKQLITTVTALKKRHPRKPLEFQLQSARLRYFNDMTSFPLWNGEHNPFQ